MQDVAFQPATPADWEAQALKELRGEALQSLDHTPVAGVRMPPIVHQPGAPPHLHRVAGGWKIAHAYRHREPTAAGCEIAKDLAGGLQLVWLCRHYAEAPRGRGGVAWQTVEELGSVLAEVPLSEFSVVLEAGANGPAAAQALLALTKSRNVDPGALTGAILADPLHELACTGQLTQPLDQAFANVFELAEICAHAPNLRTIGVSAVPYHEAGATAVQEVAWALASGIEVLRRGQAAGHSIEQLAPRFVFHLALGRNLLATCAKLRAARSLWAAVVGKAGGCSAAQRMYLHASGSWRELACAEPWSNLLRATVQGVAATMGEVDSFDLPGFDSGDRPDGAFARRLARNTQLLLRDESHLAKVCDPAGHSGYVESLTQTIAREAWALVRSIESGGGMSAALLRGDVQQACITALAEQQARVARLQHAIVGINRFAVLDPPAVPEVCAPDSSSDLVDNVEPATVCQALTRQRLAAGFEVLRGQTAQGPRPKVGVVALGPLKRHKNLVQQATALLESAGFEVVDPTPAAGHTPREAVALWRQQNCSAAVLCATPEDLGEHGSALVSDLTNGSPGPLAIICIGNEPTPQPWHSQVNAWLSAGTDVLGSLSVLVELLCHAQEAN